MRALSQEQIFSRLTAFPWASKEKLERLIALGHTHRVARRRAIFQPGDESNRVYVLHSGIAKLCILNRSESVLVGLIAPGEVFGASALLGHDRRQFRCDALTECTVSSFTPAEFVETLLGMELAHLSQFLEATVGKWWLMLLRYANSVGTGLRERLAAALIELGGKFGAVDDRGIIITVKLTHADLAALVGASRQRTTSQLAAFEREGALIRDGRRLIIVADKLQRLTEPQVRRARAPVRESTPHGREQV
ncbi:MAG TPA: Crp/Fnr family transcriptional regulator, partial [Candidatus Binataceae bacterium]|nr:Crp/Fnr family transcriptional regulator [Candidatus Binataceae bacterium]